jgi:hypothetical protein
LGVFGNSAVRLLTNLHLRHKEKLRATAIALEYNGKPWKVGGEIYKVHRQDIRIERIRLEKVAEQRYRLRGERRKEKMKIWKSKIEASFPLVARGLSMEVLAEKLGCSLRTAYRRKEKYRETQGLEQVGGTLSL